MKHFHLNDRKKQLAHEIFNETQLLMELEKEKSVAFLSLSDSSKNYSDVHLISQKLKKLTTDINRQETKIKALQIEHDRL